MRERRRARGTTGRWNPAQVVGSRYPGRHPRPSRNERGRAVVSAARDAARRCRRSPREDATVRSISVCAIPRPTQGQQIGSRGRADASGVPVRQCVQPAAAARWPPGRGRSRSLGPARIRDAGVAGNAGQSAAVACSSRRYRAASRSRSMAARTCGSVSRSTSRLARRPSVRTASSRRSAART